MLQDTRREGGDGGGSGFRMSRCFCSWPELQIASSDGSENMAQEGCAGQRAAPEARQIIVCCGQS